MTDRIQKILAAHGVASRRESERLIREGRVTVNGVTAEIGQSAQPGSDIIRVDGALLRQREEPVYIMLNKPRGFITTKNDDLGRKTVMDLVRDVNAEVYPVGRLDMNTEGLLLLTNDGSFANIVSHPSSDKIKTYEIHARGDIHAAVAELRRPMDIGAYTVHAASVEIISDTGNDAVISIAIYEGRNRQIRKMCAQCGLNVRALKRVAIGTLNLGSLESGKWRFLADDEVRSLMVLG